MSLQRILGWNNRAKQQVPRQVRIRQPRPHGRDLGWHASYVAGQDIQIPGHGDTRHTTWYTTRHHPFHIFAQPRRPRRVKDTRTCNAVEKRSLYLQCLGDSVFVFQEPCSR